MIKYQLKFTDSYMSEKKLPQLVVTTDNTIHERLQISFHVKYEIIRSHQFRHKTLISGPSVNWLISIFHLATIAEDIKRAIK